MKAEYTEQQKSIAGEVVNIACGYVEPLSVLSDVIAKLDVLTSFAQVSADAPEPYVRPRLLPKGLTDYCNVKMEINDYCSGLMNQSINQSGFLSGLSDRLLLYQSVYRTKVAVI